MLAAAVRGCVLAMSRVQLAKALLETSALKLTVPLGALAEVGVLSVTVAVQLLGLDRKSVVEGKRVDVGGRRIIKKKTKAAELPRRLATPPQLAWMGWGPTIVEA